MKTLTDQDIKCLRKCLTELIQILDKLDEGAVKITAPKSKKETKKEGVNRYLNLIEEKESKKLKQINKR